MQNPSFDDILENLVVKDPRYPRGAYLFVREALDHTQSTLAKGTKESVRHVTGQELLTGIRNYGLSLFGPMAFNVFAEWGIHRCEDFGEIVFNMVEIGLLSKTSKDSREDFKDGYDFRREFRDPFLPPSKIGISEAESKSN